MYIFLPVDIIMEISRSKSICKNAGTFFVKKMRKTMEIILSIYGKKHIDKSRYEMYDNNILMNIDIKK